MRGIVRSTSLEVNSAHPVPKRRAQEANKAHARSGLAGQAHPKGPEALGTLSPPRPPSSRLSLHQTEHVRCGADARQRLICNGKRRVSMQISKSASAWS